MEEVIHIFILLVIREFATPDILRYLDVKYITSQADIVEALTTCDNTYGCVVNREYNGNKFEVTTSRAGTPVADDSLVTIAEKRNGIAQKAKKQKKEFEHQYLARDTSRVMCHSCDKKGHYAFNSPDKKLPATTDSKNDRSKKKTPLYADQV